jgi:hypothetical protein
MDATTAEPLGLAILTETPRGLAIWHVSYGFSADGSLREPMLSGAWVPVDADLRKQLVVARLVLDDEHAEECLDSLSGEIGRTQSELTERYQEKIHTSSKHLVAPQWLPVPRLDVSATAAYGTPQAMRLPVARATWARRLLSVWVNTETKRISRKYLIEPGGGRTTALPFKVDRTLRPRRALAAWVESQRIYPRTRERFALRSRVRWRVERTAVPVPSGTAGSPCDQ